MTFLVPLQAALSPFGGKLHDAALRHFSRRTICSQPLPKASSRFGFLFERDLFRKPLHTFRDHALDAAMAHPIQIRMGGYGPPTTGFSRALKLIGDRLVAAFGNRVSVKYVWNIMDLGYRAEDILWLVEHGLLTLGYQSSSYLTAPVPQLGLVDLPFLFKDTGQARAAMDGELGRMLARKIEERVDYRILGFFENGFRQISNRIRPIRTPADLAGLRIRVLPSEVQARTFALLGAAAARSHRSDCRDRQRRDRRAGEPAVQHGHLRGAQIPPLPHALEPLLHFAADLRAPALVRRLAGQSQVRHAGRSRRGRRVPA